MIPAPPPGVGGAITTLLSWLYWVAWVAVIGAGIFGGFKVATGDSEGGKKYVAGAIVGGYNPSVPLGHHRRGGRRLADPRRWV